MAIAGPPGDRASEWVGLASPAPGRSFLPYVEAVAAETRRTIAAVAVDVAEERLSALYAPRVGGLGFTYTAAAERLGRAAVAQWMCGIAVGAFDATASLIDAEEWFFGELANELPRLSLASEPPSLKLTAEEAYALLPYALDRHRPGTRRELLRDEDVRQDRRRRKRDGVYYTPADVADAMAALVSTSLRGSVLDPACGTGVFLRAAVERGATPESVYGVDVDEQAVEAATFVLLAAALRTRGCGCTPWAKWHQLRMNIACTNSLLLRRGGGSERRAEEVESAKGRLEQDAVPSLCDSHDAARTLGSLFPDLAGGVGAVLSNPPYAPLGKAAIAVEPGFFAAYGSTVRANDRSEAAFVEFAWKLTDPGGVAALVLPLSVATSSRAEFVRLRAEIEKTPGRYSFAMFDRAPDALFGDDVKTRNVILVREPAETTIVRTTPLLRWTSRSRMDFLRGLRFTQVEPRIAALVPKVGSPSEAKLYSALRGLGGALGESVVASRVVLPQNAAPRDSRGKVVLVAPTAYNWIGVAREAWPFVDRCHDSASGMLELSFGDSASADAAFALLSSKFVLWLWRAESDGFHVTTSFVRGIPFALGHLPDRSLRRLAAAGASLWEEAQARPTISVNRGRTTVGFATSDLSRSVLVDQEVTEAFGLPADVRDAVRGWHDNLLVVDFAEERRVAAAWARRISA